MSKGYIQFDPAIMVGAEYPVFYVVINDKTHLRVAAFRTFTDAHDWLKFKDPKLAGRWLIELDTSFV